MILADTSAWVEYDWATGSAVDQRLTELIRDEGPLAITEPVLMEVMAGARDDDRVAALRRLLLRFDLLAVDTAADFEAAARIYFRCRRDGVTPRGMVDCLIASVAHRRQATLLAHDGDLSRGRPRCRDQSGPRVTAGVTLPAGGRGPAPLAASAIMGCTRLAPSTASGRTSTALVRYVSAGRRRRFMGAVLARTLSSQGVRDRQLFRRSAKEYPGYSGDRLSGGRQRAHFPCEVRPTISANPLRNSDPSASLVGGIRCRAVLSGSDL